MKNIAKSNVESKHFYQKNDENAMMKYHNDYDVRKSKNLFKWQRWVLNQICDQMSRFEKNKSILNLSKKMKRKIEKTQFDQQLTVLFIDVNRSFSYVYENDCAEMFIIKNNWRIAQTLRNSKCLYEKSKSNRSRNKACARRSWYAAIENTWSDRCVEEACFFRVIQLQIFLFKFTDERDCFHVSAHVWSNFARFRAWKQSSCNECREETEERINIWRNNCWHDEFKQDISCFVVSQLHDRSLSIRRHVSTHLDSCF